MPHPLDYYGNLTLSDISSSVAAAYHPGSPQPHPATFERSISAVRVEKNLVTFGRTDPLHLTERFANIYGTANYVFAFPFDREPPENMECLFTDNFRLHLPSYSTVYCGTGATMFEALLAGCTVRLISSPNLDFAVAFSIQPQYDHNLLPVYWDASHLTRLFREIRDRM